MQSKAGTAAKEHLCQQANVSNQDSYLQPRKTGKSVQVFKSGLNSSIN